MNDVKDYYEAVIKALVDKLNLAEWQLANTKETVAKQRKRIEELERATASR